ncbi:MAG: S-layer homology domain-containing protein [Clostridia bacterium]|nr:S-layer homology domain-containing protein [Clostridia bacterium]
MRKIIPVLTLSLAFQSFAGLSLNHVCAEELSMPVVYNFDENSEHWNVGESKGTVELEHLSEDGNGFLRLRASEGDSYNLTDGINAVPNTYVELDSEFLFEKNSEAVISVDVRTSDMSLFTKGLMLNRNELDVSVANEVQYNLATLWGWNRNNELLTYEQNASRTAGPYKRAKGTVFAEELLDNNEWYTVKSIVYTDDNAIPQYLKVIVSNNDEVIAQTEKLEIENDALKLINGVSRLDITMMQSTVTVPEGGAQIDFDNVKIYTVTNERSWSIVCENGNNVFTNIDSVDLAFSGAMKEDTLTNENIVLSDSDGAAVNYIGKYDKNSYRYTMTAKNKLDGGKYSISVDKDAVKGLDIEGNTISLSENSPENVEFIVFNGTLPEAKNLKITGKLKENSTLKANAEYSQAEGIDGTVEFSWQYSDSENGKFIDIYGETGNSFVVTSDYTDKFIRFSATAVTNDGIRGNSVYSDVLKPLDPPVAANVKITGLEYAGMQLSLSYDFTDVNGDAEGKSVYEWYISEDKSSWNIIEGKTGLVLTTDDSMAEKYIKAAVTPVSADAPYIGEKIYSAVFGPIKAGDSLNLISNPGFETGDAKGWGFRNAAGDTATVTATQEDVYEGEWAGKIAGQTSNSTMLVYSVKSKPGITYLASAMMKVAPESTVDTPGLTYYGEGNPTGTTHKVYPNGYAVITKDSWKPVRATIYAAGESFSMCPQYWAGGSAGFVAYIDNFYIAPLLAADIDTITPESMEIPVSGENSAAIYASAVRNQLGGTEGLENEKAFWEIDDDVKGVYIKDNKLYVTSSATSGTFILKAVCEPSFSGATQTRFVKEIPIELITNNNKSPKAENVTLKGDTSLGSVVQLSYDFYQVDGNEDKSVITWYISDEENGKYEQIEMPDKFKLNITSEYAEKYIKAEVDPADSEGNKGSKVVSNTAGPKKTPVAKNVKISGKGYIGDKLTGSYEYYDFNNDIEENSIIKWLKSDKKDGEYKEIVNSSELEYTVREEDINSWFKMSVTPIAENSPYQGETVLSEALQGPFAPIAKNVTIAKSGKILTGKYVYESPNGVDEGSSVCEWFENGVKVSEGTTYTVDFTGTKTIEFRVTPMAVKMPYEGESVSCKTNITGSTSSGGGSGSGGGGSKVSTTILPEIPKAPAQNENTKPTAYDISQHWSESYANTVLEKGIMSVDENGNFNPDKSVTRAEMITYIFKALSFEEIEYRDEFEDVKKDAAYANMLQTMVDKGIISKDVTFRPEDNVSRQEVCKILSIALGMGESDFDLSVYNDNALIGDWALIYVKNIVNSKLMTGVSETEFSPRTNITNGQIAKIISMIVSGTYTVPDTVNNM